MSNRMQLAVLSADGSATHVVPIQEAPVHVGRAPSNHLVLQDEAVSWHHAQVWLEAGSVWIRDLGSRNGTFVNDQLVKGTTPILPGDKLLIGSRVKLEVRGELPVSDSGSYSMLMVEDVQNGVRVHFRGDRFHIGSGPDAHLRIEGAKRVVTISVHDEDELWIGRENEEGPLSLNETFTAGGRSFRVIRATAQQAPTIEYDAHRYPYALSVTLNGRRGPEAQLERPDSEEPFGIGGNGAVLLYLLAKKILEDRESGASHTQAGWCSDHDIVIGIWGRSGSKNNLHVLLHRLRTRLDNAGFDPWFIEKKRRGVRARLTDVEVT